MKHNEKVTKKIGGKSKVILILGPTASGKTSHAVSLAKEINGEIISADSRQVYKGMDIGSGKDLDEYDSIPYHLIDIIEPGNEFSVSDFQEMSLLALSKIIERGSFPIICGGTGHYIKALLEDYTFDNPTDFSLSQSLEKLSRFTLYAFIKSMGHWKSHHWESDSKRRMARFIEKHLAPTSPKKSEIRFTDTYSYRIYYTHVERGEQRARIRKRLLERLEEGLIDEVKNLLENDLTHKRLERYGLEYKWVSLYLRGSISYDSMLEKLYTEICRFAKRQMTFLRYMENAGHVLHPISNRSSFLADAIEWAGQP